MSQVNRKGEKPASSPAVDAELRRRSSAERRAPRAARPVRRTAAGVYVPAAQASEVVELYAGLGFSLGAD